MLRGKPLDSQGLGNLQKLLRSLPKLQAVKFDVLKMDNERRHIPSKDATPFTCYAFTGVRRYILWVMTKTILEGTKLQLPGDQIDVNIQLLAAHNDRKGRYAGLDPEVRLGVEDSQLWLEEQTRSLRAQNGPRKRRK